jgi:Ni,Fe-hydrogenase III small subunit/formate hydrogenlyase subunit 6/NADH:ubiquinone oxidoreductase subunit I
MFKVIRKILKYPRLTLDYPQKKLDTAFFASSPQIDHDKCTGCGACISRCPSFAIVRNESGQGVGINYDECVFCMLCAEICPASAISVTDKFEMAVKDRGELRCSPLIVDERMTLELPYKIIESQLEEKIQKVLGRSLQIREVDSGSCNGCDYEVNGLNNPFNDIERLGMHFVPSPRHADMLLVTGAVSRNMEQALVKTYNAAPDPKIVVAVGACACSGGIFKDLYATRNGIDCIVPVDVYIPGCPPRPVSILYGILKALDRI